MYPKTRYNFPINLFRFTMSIMLLHGRNKCSRGFPFGKRETRAADAN